MYCFSSFTEAGFCGDRQPSTSLSSSNGSGGTGTTATYYGAYIRINNNATERRPTFECQNNSDLYTVSGSNTGNGALDYPIGLISVDEVAYAGGVNGSNNAGYYLFTNQDYWTMSPSYFNGSYAYVFHVYLLGRLDSTGVNSASGVRPVINLRPDVTISSGTGTSTDPYVIAT